MVAWLFLLFLKYQFTKAVIVTEVTFFLLWIEHANLSLKTPTEERLYAHECTVNYCIAFYMPILKL